MPSELGGTSSITRGKRAAALASCAIFVGGAAFELGRVLLDRPWHGVAEGVSDLASTALSALWLSAVGLQWGHWQRPRLATAALLTNIAGAMAFVMHAAVVRVFGNPLGLLYLLLAAAQVPLLKRGFRSAGEPGREAATRA